MAQKSALDFNAVMGRVRSILAKDVVTTIVGSEMVGPIVRLYDGVSFEPLGEWVGCSSISVAYDEHGPASADIALPRNSTYLQAANICPHGLGVVVEIDARNLGTDVNGRTISIPDVWLGRVSTVQASSQGATATVTCDGPSAWLDGLTVARQGRTREPAGAIARRLVDQYPASRISMGGLCYYGPGSDTDLGGDSLLGTLTALADNRGETFTLTAVPCEARLLLDWLHPLHSEDRSAAVQLIAGTNCEWDATFALAQTASELMAVGESYDAGSSTVASHVAAPTMAHLGRRAALTAELSSAAALATLEGGDLVIRPDIPTRAELALTLAANLRRMLVPPLLLQVTVTDPALWASLAPGVLVGVDIADPLGVYDGGAVGRVLDRAFDLSPSLACNVGLELWRTANE